MYNLESNTLVRFKYTYNTSLDPDPFEYRLGLLIGLDSTKLHAFSDELINFYKILDCETMQVITPTFEIVEVLPVEDNKVK